MSASRKQSGGAAAGAAMLALAIAAMSVPASAEVLFERGNIYAVVNNPPNVSSFTLDRPAHISVITTYHWNDARGSTPGTVALMNAAGDMFGPWQATGGTGQGGVPNAYWIVRPETVLPAGEYDVIDSEVETWSHNPQSNGAGMVKVEGRKLAR